MLSKVPTKNAIFNQRSILAEISRSCTHRSAEKKPLNPQSESLPHPNPLNFPKCSKKSTVKKTAKVKKERDESSRKKPVSIFQTEIDLRDDCYHPPPPRRSSTYHLPGRRKIGSIVPTVNLLPHIRTRKKRTVDPEERAALARCKSEIRDAETERWLQSTNRFPEARWSIKEKRTLRKLFDRIDEDGSGEIDVEELADPLLSSGIAKTMCEVRGLVQSVDDDNSGEIGFDEFLSIMRPKDSKQKQGGQHAHDDDRQYQRNSAPARLLPTIKKKKSNDLWKDVQANLKKTSKLNGTEGAANRPKNRPNNDANNPLGTGTQNNPIARLQKMQEQNGDMDIKSVLTFKRRKLLLDATMGEAQRREAALDDINRKKEELRDLAPGSVSKLRRVYEIQNVYQKLDKTQEEKQLFVLAIRGIVAREMGPDSSLSRRQSQGSVDKSFAAASHPSASAEAQQHSFSKIEEEEKTIQRNVTMLAKHKASSDNLGTRRAFIAPKTSRTMGGLPGLGGMARRQLSFDVSEMKKRDSGFLPLARVLKKG